MGGEQKAVLNALEDGFVALAERVEPSVVKITATAAARPARQAQPRQPEGGNQEMPDDIPAPFREFFRRGPRGGGGAPIEPPRPSGGTGSGVIIRETGNTVYVLTNNHVVDGFTRFKVRLENKQEYPHAELVGKDQRTDLAVIRFTAREPLPAGSVAEFGDSDRVRVGQWAIAIGSPLGFESTLTVGVISAKGRLLEGLGDGTTNYADLIQTDASINPGNSGGPLVNIDGQIIGINVAISAQGSGIGFAIPVNIARMVSDQLIQNGRVVRSYLGVGNRSGRELAPELAEYLGAPAGGALIDSVNTDGPAQRGGMQESDVIVRFGTHDVRNFTDLENATAVTQPRTPVPVRVIRNGRPVNLTVTVDERPSEEKLRELALRSRRAGAPQASDENAETPVEARYGLMVRNTQRPRGAEVAQIQPGSPAISNFRLGDVIVEVNKTATPNVMALQAALNSVGPRVSGVVVRVRDAEGSRFEVIRP
jgi:serine protease Do